MKTADLAIVSLSSLLVHGTWGAPIQLGPRPFWLIDQMEDSDLKDVLTDCKSQVKEYKVSDFSIGHRGACLQFPEHTLESYTAALEMGAGIVECDVTFTQDLELVCRHSQCDLHTTTNVVTIPELNAKCTTPWSTGVEPNCCTSDFTLEELKTLCAKMDSSTGILNGTAQDYAFGGTPLWRTELYDIGCPKIPTHKESIELIGNGGGYFTPELKGPSVEMPFNGTYSQRDYAQQMIDEYVEAGISPEAVWPQSFNIDDVIYWSENTSFGAQAVALNETELETDQEIDVYLDTLVANNVSIVAPPLWMLVEPDTESMYKMQPSYYANASKERGLNIITWTLERTAPGLDGWYWQSLEGTELVEGDHFNLLYVLAMDVGVLGVFSDWPATTTFFANCMELKLRDASVEAETQPTSGGSRFAGGTRKLLVSAAGALNLY